MRRVKGEYRKSETYEVFHGLLASLVDAFHVLEDVVRETVDDGYAYVVVVFVLCKSMSGREAM